MGRKFNVISSDIPFWWQFDVILGPQERKLSRTMLKGMLDFASCWSVSNCSISQSPKWELYSNHYLGTRTRLHAPVSEIHSEVDVEFDDKCAFFERIIAGKSGIVGQAPPTNPTFKPTKKKKGLAILKPFERFLKNILAYVIKKILID